MNTHAIKKEFEKAIRRGWKKLYVMVDLHESILIPNWSSKELTHDYYPIDDYPFFNKTGHSRCLLFIDDSGTKHEGWAFVNAVNDKAGVKWFSNTINKYFIPICWKYKNNYDRKFSSDTLGIGNQEPAQSKKIR